MTRQLSPLPIDDCLAELLAALRANSCAVLQAPPGAGKTTRVPPALLLNELAGEGKILVLQPRRVAARATAARIAAEQGWRLGEEVGFQVRFEAKIGPRTRIELITEGILLQRLQRNPFLEGVSIVVFDEFHERSLTSDLSLAMTRQVQQAVRSDLKLLVMSATLAAEPIAAYLDRCPIVRSEGRGMWWCAIPLERWPRQPEWRTMLKSYWDDAFGDRRQEIVFIGTGMDQRALTRRLDACLVTTPEADGLVVDAWKALPDPFPAWKR